MIQHLACVMDGNRRWAERNGLSLKDGVVKGLARIDVVVDFCVQHKIPYLSLYAFSIENFKRTFVERMCIFNVLVERGVDYARHMASKGVNVRIIGDRSLFPSEVINTCNLIEQITAGCTGLSLQLLFCYGGRQEIVSAAQRMARDLCEGTVKAATVTEDFFKRYLWLADIPDPDLIIRTGFARRLRNFLIYQAAYSELHFPDCLWPDISMDCLKTALEGFCSTKRNFGT